MREFRIFYSWQSDLPGNKTRNFIRECINEAIDLAQESEAFEAQRDEATTGTTGSPNIVTTLFSKIDNCDLFIADLSLCFTEDQKKAKKSPNPNVLLELGYAVKTLGWERVICLCNTDYGVNYPFDIAHNRITGFSFEGKSRKEVKGDIAKIIFTNIRDLRKQPPIAKSGVATHIIGSYDFMVHKVVDVLVPIEIRKQKSFVHHNEVLVDEANKLLLELQGLTNKINTIKEDENEFSAVLAKRPLPTFNVQNQVSDTLHTLTGLSKKSETPVRWKDVEEDKILIKHWLGTDVSDEFFDLGRLKKEVEFPKEPYLNGTDDEKAKYEKLHALSNKLALLNIRTNYIATFDGLYYIPLAIQNISSIQDENIRVIVKVEIGEIVEPDEQLICEECQDLQGSLCRNDNDKNDIGIIGELFTLPEDNVIKSSKDLSYSLDCLKKIPVFANGNIRYAKTEEHYKQELANFIAISAGDGFYEFNINTLRPGERSWLGYGMLIRPSNGEVKLNYQIHSKYSMGNLNGILEMKNN